VATPKRRIVMALVLAVVMVGIGLWGHVPAWRTAVYVGVFVFYAVVDLVLLRWVRSRPDGGASLPVSIGGGVLDKSPIHDSMRSSVGLAELGRPVRRYVRWRWVVIPTTSFGTMTGICLLVLFFGKSLGETAFYLSMAGLLTWAACRYAAAGIITVREHGLVVRIARDVRVLTKKLPWTAIREIALDAQANGIGVPGRALAIRLTDGSTIKVEAFWESETAGAKGESSPLEELVGQLNAAPQTLRS
jgi:hypothetical protein